MRYKIFTLILLALLLAACDRVVEVEPLYPTEVTPTLPPIVSTVTPVPTNIPTQTPETASIQAVGTPGAGETQDGESSRELLHFILVVVAFPVLLAVIWWLAETALTNYLRPIGIDLTKMRVKAQDGLFIDATVSMTARKMLLPAALTLDWKRVKGFVEKEIEQRLMHEATQMRAIDDLEHKLYEITSSFKDLSIMRDVSNDFGIEILRFNVEVGYPQETMDALNRRAEASAGGMAYLAFADAAEMEPSSTECRELYTVYQQTSGQVDAARNLGGGITSLASMLKSNNPEQGGGNAPE
jgi:hypothetical protein